MKNHTLEVVKNYTFEVRNNRMRKIHMVIFFITNKWQTQQRHVVDERESIVGLDRQLIVPDEIEALIPENCVAFQFYDIVESVQYIGNRHNLILKEDKSSYSKIFKIVTRNPLLFM